MCNTLSASLSRSVYNISSLVRMPSHLHTLFLQMSMGQHGVQQSSIRCKATMNTHPLRSYEVGWDERMDAVMCVLRICCPESSAQCRDVDGH